MDGRCGPFSAPGLSLQPPPGKKKVKEERREGGVGEDRGRRRKGKEEGKKDTFTKGSSPWLSSLSYNLDSFYPSPGLLNPISIYAIKGSRNRTYTTSPPHITGHDNSFELNAT